MEPLFATEEDYEAFNKRHEMPISVKKGDLSPRITATAIWVLMQVPPPPRLLL